jgi:hypothetical protein
MQEGLLKPKDRDRLLVAKSLNEVMTAMETFTPTYDLIPEKVRD